MKDNIKLLMSDTIIKSSLFISVFFLTVQTVLMLFFQKNLPPYIPFFNSQPWGEERLIPSAAILFLPLMLFLVFIINNFISSILYTRHTLIARILTFNSLLFIFLGLLAYLQIILLVF